MNKLTTLKLKSLTEKDVGITLHYDGLRGKVRNSKLGIRVDFSYRYSIQKKSRDIRVGTWPDIELKDINSQLSHIKRQIQEGLDPIEVRKIEKEKRRKLVEDELKKYQELTTRPTISSLFAEWKKLMLSQHKDEGAAVEQIFNKDVLPLIGNMAIEDVKKAHITSILHRTLQRNAKRLTQRVLGLLRQMFAFAIDKDIISYNPTSSLKKSNFGGKLAPRDRVLDSSELKELFLLIPEANLRPSTQHSLYILISTCCRVGELITAKWSEIDFENKMWVIPKTKSGRPHKIYLSNFAIYHFEQIKLLSLSETWVLPDREDKSCVDMKSITKQVHDRQNFNQETLLAKRTTRSTSLKIGEEKWTPHDLRRTGATLMGELGVSEDVIEKCLNHITRNRMVLTYQRQSKLAEQKKAWEQLGGRLEEIYLESKVQEELIGETNAGSYELLVA